MGVRECWKPSLNASIVLFSILLRILVGIHPHSGQGDHHGAGGGTTTFDGNGIGGNHDHDADTSATTTATNKKYGGDYEAQRHWMEMTLHLPLSEWYHHDLEYWGLDYPPLTAFHSYACGWVAHALGSLHHHVDDDGGRVDGDDGVVCNEAGGGAVSETGVEPGAAASVSVSNGGGGGLAILKDMVALHESRFGNFSEQAGAKSYMRATVLLFDVLVYFSAVWTLAARLGGGASSRKTAWLVLFALSQPSLVLIDHGHFQYNSISLGLALWSFHFMTLPSSPSMFGWGSSLFSRSFGGPVVGSILFTLALNFKQMELYHAPAVFAYLLGRCLRPATDGSNGNGTVPLMFIQRFLALGMTVVLTFAALWWPFAVYPRIQPVPEEWASQYASSSPSTQKRLHLDGVLQVLRRIFPFERGVFEGKVSNVWCALSVKPFSLRERLASVGALHLLPILALAATLALILPPSWALFRGGRRRQPPKNNNVHERDLRLLLWGSAATALAFFLASYQVHEKGILIALAPLSLLGLEHGDGIPGAPAFVSWFGVVSVWSMWPLLQMDQLHEAYVCCLVVFGCVVWVRRPWLDIGTVEDGRGGTKVQRCEEDVPVLARSDLFFLGVPHADKLLPMSLLGAVCLHVAEWMVVPPSNLPDLFAVLWSLAGCAMFCLAYVTMIWAMFRPLADGPVEDVVTKIE